MQALVLLASRPGQLIDKAELMTALWAGTFVGEEALTQTIRKLRAALGDDPRNPRVVETVLKRGYRFLPRVERAPDVVRVEPSRRPVRGWIVAALGAALALAAAFVLLRREPDEGALEPGRLRRVRLTSTPEREQEAVFSPDGKTYAFVAQSGDGGDYDVYLASFAGGSRVRLTRSPAAETYPQFSPDGSAVAFYRSEDDGLGSIWTVSPLGGNERRLVRDAAWPAWSPDGSEMAYATRSPAGEWSLRRTVLATGVEREVARLPQWISSLAWSPDGAWLAWTDERRVWRVAAGGGAPLAVGPAAEYVRSLSWEPDSRSLVCDANWMLGGGNELWRVRLAGGAPEPITAGGGGLYHPAVSADGGRLLYTAEHKTRQLVRVDSSGHGPAVLDLPTTIECFDVDPTGLSIAVSDWDPGPGETSLGRFDLARPDFAPLGRGLCPAFSPDGARLAFLGDRPEEEGLWLLDLAGGGQRRLARGLGPPGPIERNLDRRPAWTPDGRRLVVQALGDGTDDGLILIEVGGGASRRLVAGSFSPPALSPDGSWLAASGRIGEERGLFLVDVATGRSRRLTERKSYRAAPVWDASSRGLRLLVDEQVDPRLLHLDLDGREIDPPIRFERAADPSFWGIFDFDEVPGRGWIYFLERYEGDLFLLQAG